MAQNKPPKPETGDSADLVKQLQEERAARKKAEDTLAEAAKKLGEQQEQIGTLSTKVEDLEDQLEEAEEAAASVPSQLEQQNTALLKENESLRIALRKATKDEIPNLQGKACVLKTSVSIDTTNNERVPGYEKDICAVINAKELERLRRNMTGGRKVLPVKKELIDELVASGLATPG